MAEVEWPQFSDYKPLDRETNEIRLLRLRPIHTDGSLHAALEVYPLEHTPEYNALSYEWGDVGNPGTIVLDGQTVRIRRNLYTFLYTLANDATRLKDYLWADALCINQQEVAERNHQVQLMADIYSRSAHVYAWLGQASHEVDRGLDSMLTYFESAKDGPRQTAGLKGLMDRLGHDVDPGEESSHTSQKMLDTMVRCFIDLCARSYWTRLWIVQELGLSQTVTFFCGHHVISEDMLAWYMVNKFMQMDAYEEFIRTRLTESDAPSRYLVLANWPSCRLLTRVGLDRPGDLKALLYTYHTSKCSDLRDKVYGMHALTRPSQRVSPDYNHSRLDLYYAALSLHAHVDFELESILMPSLNLSIDDLASDLHDRSKDRLMLRVDPLGSQPEARARSTEGSSESGGSEPESGSGFEYEDPRFLDGGWRLPVIEEDDEEREPAGGGQMYTLTMWNRSLSASRYPIYLYCHRQGGHLVLKHEMLWYNRNALGPGPDPENSHQRDCKWYVSDRPDERMFFKGGERIVIAAEFDDTLSIRLPRRVLFQLVRLEYEGEKFLAKAATCCKVMDDDYPGEMMTQAV